MSKRIWLAFLLVEPVIACADTGDQLKTVFDGAQQNQVSPPTVQASGEDRKIIFPKSKFQGKTTVETPENLGLSEDTRDEERKKTEIGLIFGGAAFAISTGIAIAAFSWGAVMLLIVTAGLGVAVGYAAIGLYLLFKGKS